MSEPKDKKKQIIPTRQPQKRINNNPFPYIRKMPEPVALEEIMGLRPIQPDDHSFDETQPLVQANAEIAPVLEQSDPPIPVDPSVDLASSDLTNPEISQPLLADLDVDLRSDLISIEPGLLMTPSTDTPASIQPRHADPVILEPSRRVTPSLKDPVTKQPGQEITRLLSDDLPGYRTPNFLDDEIMPTLTAPEQVILRRLYRLSYGFNRQTTDPVGVGALAKKCNLGETCVKNALKNLQRLNLITVIPDTSGNPKGGNRYTVLTGAFSDRVTTRRGQTITGSSGGHINHDHEDLNNTDHHQAETKRIYQQLTGNNWHRADQVAYEKIKTVPLSMIEQTLKAVIQRAPQKPATLAYFIKEVLNPTQPLMAAKNQRKGQLRAIIERLVTAHVGGTYTIGELVEDTKRACAREGVLFDNDLFNEIVS